jgi:hypothetical protein
MVHGSGKYRPEAWRTLYGRPSVYMWGRQCELSSFGKMDYKLSGMLICKYDGLHWHYPVVCWCVEDNCNLQESEAHQKRLVLCFPICQLHCESAEQKRRVCMITRWVDIRQHLFANPLSVVARSLEFECCYCCSSLLSTLLFTKPRASAIVVVALLLYWLIA